MSNHIRKFESFKVIKHKFDKYNEHVIQIEDKYKVGGIEVSQSLINSYVKKVKDETGKNIRQMFSDMEIAEQLVKYVAVNKLDVDKIPAAALLGGEIPMDDDEIIDDTTSTVATEDGLNSPEESENLDNINQEVPPEPEQDEDTLPTSEEEHEFEEPSLDEEQPEGSENLDNQESGESEESDESEKEEESEDNESNENDEREEESGNNDLPI